MEFIESNKGGRKLCFQGNMYTTQKKSANMIYWKCTKRTEACTARVKMTSDYLDPQIIGEHNHEPSDTRINVSKACVDMRTNARNNAEKPGNIFANALEQLDNLTGAHTICCSMQKNNQKS